MDLFRFAVVLSALLALAGQWAPTGLRPVRSYWPVPLMASGAILIVQDLTWLLGPAGDRPESASLVLGVWAGLVVNLIGWIEIRALRCGMGGAHALLAPAFVIASGLALLGYAEREPVRSLAAFVAGLLVLLAGALLVASRTGLRGLVPLHSLWPIALLLAAVVGVQGPPPPDPLVEAQREIEALLTAWHREGREVVQVALGAGRAPPVPARRFLVDGNEVSVYLTAHDADAIPEVHLSPRVAVPPSVGGVPHIHVGPHILVACVTADPRFARQLDSLVHNLVGQRRQRPFAPVATATR